MQQIVQSQAPEVDMESVDIPGTQLRVSRVALGTWAMGGFMWGGADERESIATIHVALDQGINLIDTAPAYGFGVSEEIVGRAVAGAGLRSQAIIATKVGLEWRGGKVYRNATPDRITREIDESTSTRSTGLIRSYPSRKPRTRCVRFTNRGRSARSA
jgi:aryl-alcohol dehydrogenase-like predicted oxidoreductase